MTKNEVNKEVIRKWVEALESGEYTQGSGALAPFDGNGKVTYCCLGVLCELAFRDGKCSQAYRLDNDVLSYDAAETYLPRSVVEWAGLDGTDPFVIVNNGSTSLSKVNDDGMPFKLIAKLIRERFLEEVSEQNSN